MARVMIPVITLIVGVALGYLIGAGAGSSEPEVAFDPPRRERPSIEVTEQPTVPEPVSTPAPIVSQAPVAQSGASDIDAGEFAAVLALVPLEAPLQGTGVLTGTVSTASGEPLAGAKIVAAALRDNQRVWQPQNDDPKLADSIREVVRDHRFYEQNKREVRSDAEGNFLLQGLGASHYQVAGELEGYAIEPVGNQSWSGFEPGDHVRLRAQAIASVTFDVRLEDGSQPESALIEWGSMGSSQTQGWSPQSPEFDLPPGRYDVTAMLPGALGMMAVPGRTSRVQKLNLVAGEDPGVITLKIGSQPGIHGRLILPPGFEESYARVQAMKLRSNKTPTAEDLRSNGIDSGSMGFERDAYAFDNLAAGRYFLGVFWLDHYSFAATAIVEVGDSPVEHDIELQPPGPEDYVMVRVLSPEDEPLAEVQIMAGFRSDHGSTSGGGQAIVQPDGSIMVFHARMMGRDSEEVQEGTNYLTVTSPEYGQKEVEYQAGRDRSLTVKFGSPAMLTVTVTGIIGSDLEGTMSLVLYQDDQVVAGRGGNHRWRHHMMGGGEQSGFDEQGRAELGPVEPGSYKLRANVTSQRHREVTAATYDVTLTAGANSITVPLPQLYSVTVTTSGVEKGGYVSLQPRVRDSGYYGQSEETGDDGSVTFESVPAGDYVIRAAGGEMPVAVYGNASVFFEAKVENAFAISIHGEAGHLTEQGFKEGDIVIGTSSGRFENVSGWQQTLVDAVAAGGQLRLTVDRKGEILTLAVDPSKLLLRSDDVGGWFNSTVY